MLLWTVIDKDIYMEPGLYNGREHWTELWYEYIEALVDHPDFPKKIQFWTRVGNDEWQQPYGKRYDIEYPSFWMDNNRDLKILVLPDHYMFGIKNHHTKESIRINSDQSGYFKK